MEIFTVRRNTRRAAVLIFSSAKVTVPVSVIIIIRLNSRHHFHRQIQVRRQFRVFHWNQNINSMKNHLWMRIFNMIIRAKRSEQIFGIVINFPYWVDLYAVYNNRLNTETETYTPVRPTIQNQIFIIKYQMQFNV